MESWNFSSGTPLAYASEPFTGAWISTRMSKFWPGRKSAWSGGKTQPRVGHVPRRWKVWAEATVASAVSARREAKRGMMTFRVALIGNDEDQEVVTPHQSSRGL
jgi:hypothetical protein